MNILYIVIQKENVILQTQLFSYENVMTLMASETTHFFQILSVIADGRRVPVQTENITSTKQNFRNYFTHNYSLPAFSFQTFVLQTFDTKGILRVEIIVGKVTLQVFHVRDVTLTRRREIITVPLVSADFTVRFVNLFQSSGQFLVRVHWP